jgi:hypothetical protein
MPYETILTAYFKIPFDQKCQHYSLKNCCGNNWDVASIPETIVTWLGMYILPPGPIRRRTSQIPVSSNTNITTFQIAEAKLYIASMFVPVSIKPMATEAISVAYIINFSHQ